MYRIALNYDVEQIKYFPETTVPHQCPGHCLMTMPAVASILKIMLYLFTQSYTNTHTHVFRIITYFTLYFDLYLFWTIHQILQFIPTTRLCQQRKTLEYNTVCTLQIKSMLLQLQFIYVITATASKTTSRIEFSTKTKLNHLPARYKYKTAKSDTL